MMRVLVVDDNDDNLYLLRVLLQAHGFSVDEASHGAEALRTARLTPPDLIISDLLMPVMDGYTLLRHWKIDERLKKIPFIVFTATYTEPRDERLALELGADAFLIKPAEPGPLMARIREVLAKGSAESRSDPDRPFEETTLLNEYNEVLVRKLEKKALQLEQSNRELREEIAERERTEAALRESEERYRRLFHSIIDPLFVYDRETLAFLAVNDAAVAQYGYSRDEFLTMTIRDIQPPQDAPALIEMLGQPGTALEKHGVWRHRKKNGEIIEVEISAYRLDFSGRPAGVVQARDVTEQRRAEVELRLRDRAIQAVSQGIVITDPNQPGNPIIYAGAGFECITGYRPEEAIGKNCRFLQGKDTDRETVRELHAAIAAGRNCSVEILNYRKDGAGFWNQLAISPVFGPSGQLTHFVGVQSDVTERRRMEEHFRQGQKMEALGLLAGGVAHDFNNLLTVINGYSDLLRDRLAADDPMRELLSEIHRAGERAGTLTRQLLAFSRQQVIDPRLLNLNTVVSDTEKMLRRLIGEDIILVTSLNPNLSRVKADPGQIEQVLVNMAVNARDAMPRGGCLTIETRMMHLDESYCRGVADLSPGNYVMLAVSDTGCGMDEATQARIFEPFFTTKGVGKGTGLGLATVHGIVKQSRGHVAVYSEAGHGTTFKVYLPQTTGPVSGVRSDPSAQVMPEGTESVLLVEDEDAVRALASHILRRCGYRVLEATNGRDALRLSEGETGRIDLLISDVVMPYMGGRALAEQLVVTRPDCRVLFLSGYTDDAVVRHGVLEAEFAFLQKPFTASSLAQKVRSVLDASANKRENAEHAE